MLELQGFLNLGSLTNALAQVVQLGAANLTVTDDLDLLDGRSVDGEHLLDADAVGQTTNGEGLLDTAVLLGDNGTLEDLDTLTVTFLNLQVDLDGVTDGDGRNVSLLLLLNKSLHEIHNNFLLLYRRSWR